MAAQRYAVQFDGYCPDPEDTPDASGIYVVYTGHEIDEDVVRLRKLLYIGEADDIRDRLTHHERLKDWLVYLRRDEQLWFSFALIPITSTRMRVEAAEIFRHKPICNTEYKNKFPFDLTEIVNRGTHEYLDDTFIVSRT
ncbi:MAG: hypothetical protein C7B43_16600 [Sulfobacillus benefaciens]|jgi:excinuclease UvrABC nuclease subunit|uniref:GIY-YIG domain-containing protein n=1 Tax=Sulfobacillus benefaciens TaxID=453960 RepID=A0A2T2WTF7_9FIRM|nr:MAG: hypothetical protein C7B43_16600 [Sulfobacillus benefaciens]HBQ95752.1 hypothetical protein [Sulfobacillus sp.]